MSLANLRDYNVALRFELVKALTVRYRTAFD